MDEDEGSYVYCYACSLAGAAERGVYHEEPVCPLSTTEQNREKEWREMEGKP